MNTPVFGDFQSIRKFEIRRTNQSNARGGKYKRGTNAKKCRISTYCGFVLSRHQNKNRKFLISKETQKYEHCS